VHDRFFLERGCSPESETAEPFRAMRTPPKRVSRLLRGLEFKLVVGALPMRKFSAMRPALRDPDAIGAFANAIFVRRGSELDCWRMAS
jgi:hypothetical protein